MKTLLAAKGDFIYKLAKVRGHVPSVPQVPASKNLSTSRNPYHFHGKASIDSQVFIGWDS